MENQIIGKKILREKYLKNMLTNEFFKPIIVSKEIMGRFEKIEMKGIRPVKNTWYDWLINYIPEPIKKIVDGFKGKSVSFF